jgi:hypothetical protein
MNYKVVAHIFFRKKAFCPAFIESKLFSTPSKKLIKTTDPPRQAERQKSRKLEGLNEDVFRQHVL